VISKATLKKSLARAASPVGALCGVANARNSCGYCCALRLAAHPDPQRTLSAQFVQRIPGDMRTAQNTFFALTRALAHRAPMSASRSIHP